MDTLRGKRGRERVSIGRKHSTEKKLKTVCFLMIEYVCRQVDKLGGGGRFLNFSCRQNILFAIVFGMSLGITPVLLVK